MLDKKAITRTVAAIIVLVIVVAGVGGGLAYFTTQQPTAPTLEPTSTPEEFKVAFVTVTTREDYGWGGALYTAATSLEEKYADVEISFSDNVDFPEAEKAVRDYAALGYDLIVIPSEFPEALDAISDEYPNVNFVGIHVLMEKPNVSSYMLREHETGYVLGVLAGLMTETDRLGTISGEPYPDVARADNAFYLGARSVNPDVDITTIYVGWMDPVAGKDAAKSMIDAGADIIWQHADLSGLGVIEGVSEARAAGKDVLMIGNAEDQNQLGPDFIISSNLYYHDYFVEVAYKQIKAGTFGNEVFEMGLSDGLDMIGPYHGLVPDDVAAEVNDVKNAIISGEIEVQEIGDPPPPPGWK